MHGTNKGTPPRLSFQRQKKNCHALRLRVVLMSRVANGCKVSMMETHRSAEGFCERGAQRGLGHGLALPQTCGMAPVSLHAALIKVLRNDLVDDIGGDGAHAGVGGEVHFHGVPVKNGADELLIGKR